MRILSQFLTQYSQLQAFGLIEKKIEMNIQHYMQQLGEQARAASRLMAKTDTNTKNQALRNIAA